jgi:hypothetical protein
MIEPQNRGGSMKQETVIAVALGDYVQVDGVTNFLRLVESACWRTVFPGPSMPIDEALRTVRREKTH